MTSRPALRFTALGAIAAILGGLTAAPSFAKPSLRVSDVVVGETDGKATFEIRASKVARRAIEVRYETGPSNSLGFATPPGDFAARTGTKRIRVGERRSTVRVRIRDDAVDEYDERFELALVKAKGARIRRNDRAGLGTIVDDDPPPTLSISDAEVVEGNAGEVHAEFIVTRSGYGGVDSFEWVTAAGTATADDDYEERLFGVRTYFTPSQLSVTLSVPVFGDSLDEPNETFLVRISGPDPALIADDTGVATIVDDD